MKDKRRTQRGNVVRIVTEPLLGQTGFLILSLPHKSRPALEPTQPSYSINIGRPFARDKASGARG